MNALPDTTVEVTESESVTSGGTRKIVWFVWFEEAWIHPKELPDTACETLDRASGTVWAQRLTFRTSPGTRIMRVEVRPRSEERMSPLHYLTREVRGARQKTHRAYFRVSKNGILVAEPHRPTSAE